MNPTKKPLLGIVSVAADRRIGQMGYCWGLSLRHCPLHPLVIVHMFLHWKLHLINLQNKFQQKNIFPYFQQIFRIISDHVFFVSYFLWFSTSSEELFWDPGSTPGSIAARPQVSSQAGLASRLAWGFNPSWWFVWGFSHHLYVIFGIFGFKDMGISLMASFHWCLVWELYEPIIMWNITIH